MQTLADVSRCHKCPILFLYLCEAHALDSWPLSPNAPKNHSNLLERRAAAAAFLCKWPAFQQLVQGVYVDDMDNTATIGFGLWPERFLVLKKGVVTWASTLNDEVPGDLPQQLQEAAQQTFG